jgi:hypothetical protein
LVGDSPQKDTLITRKPKGDSGTKLVLYAKKPRESEKLFGGCQQVNQTNPFITLAVALQKISALSTNA